MYLLTVDHEELQATKIKHTNEERDHHSCKIKYLLDCILLQVKTEPMECCGGEVATGRDEGLTKHVFISKEFFLT